MKLSVIIPVLNERDTLPATIAALRACHGIAEIIVADGGSTDGTVPWLQSQRDIVLVRSIRGKGPQMNVGAAAAFDASGASHIPETAIIEIAATETTSTATTAAETTATKTAASGPSDIALLFLHADCLISQPALDALQVALADRQLVGGAFYIRFAEARPRSLRLVSWGINLRARLRGSATGDQGIFVRRDVFLSIGGAPEWPLFEDVELVRRIKRAGKFVVLKTPITVSGRRYIRHGVLRTALLIYSLRLAYWLGVPPHRLKNWFKDADARRR
ncbi:MAG TPA: glycosyltransferase family 2 protein [Candidatus Angelobacter sp.]|jgi:glycosyltransferase involved in cell wall biosynthesis